MRWGLLRWRQACDGCGDAPHGLLFGCACRKASFTKAGALLSLLVMLLAAGRLMARDETGVGEQQIWFSLPVFATSLGACALFTWKLAKYDSQQAQRIQKLEDERQLRRAADALRVDGLHAENAERFEHLARMQEQILSRLDGPGGRPAP